MGASLTKHRLPHSLGRLTKMQKGFSLFEIIIVVAIFVGIVVLANQALFSTFRGSSKSQVSIKLKQAATYSFDLIERELRQASSLGTCTATSVAYTNADGASSSFVCTTGSSGYVSFGSTRITPDDVAVSGCSFSCNTAGSVKTVNLDITFTQTGPSAGLRVEELGSYQLKNQILLRN